MPYGAYPCQKLNMFPGVQQAEGCCTLCTFYILLAFRYRRQVEYRQVSTVKRSFTTSLLVFMSLFFH